MASDYIRGNEFFLQLSDFEPAQSFYYQHALQAKQDFDFMFTNAAAYELTGAAEVGGPCAQTSVPAAPLQQQPPPVVPEVRKRKINHFGDGFELSDCESLFQQPMQIDAVSNSSRKRKSSSYGKGFEMSDCEASLPQPMQIDATSIGSRKRKSTSYGDGYELSVCEAPPPQPMQIDASSIGSRRRKSVSYCGSTYDDETDDSRYAKMTAADKKQNHSEIEKRRRNKMNTYITELCSMVPMCGAMSRKLDKLTVLRMAVQHLRAVRGAVAAGPLTARPRPAYLSERELNALVLHAARDCFVLVVGCVRGRLLYVSTSVSKMLNYDKSELLGQSVFDILHPKDVSKVKEQLSAPNLSPRERLVDAKTMLPLKHDVVAGASRLCPGARRSFFCRMKCRVSATGDSPVVKEETDTSAKMRKKHVEKKYCVVQCTGYLKLWPSAETSDECGGEAGEANDDDGVTCLVAMCRALPAPPAPPPAPARRPPARRLQFASRLATDGKFLFVDHRVTLALGYLPQELLGTSLYELVHAGELAPLARTHRAALLQQDTRRTPPYHVRRKDGTLVCLQTHFKPFRNPWTKDLECIVANNTVLTDEAAHDAAGPYDLYEDQSGGDAAEMQRLIESQVESHKIGATIAEEARRSSAELSPDLPIDALHDSCYTPQQNAMVDSILGMDSSYSQVRNNVPLSAARAQSPPARDSPPASPPLPPAGFDGNSEAAMAVIMSLLEADAGLGGPVNFSGLPWPLP